MSAPISFEEVLEAGRADELHNDDQLIRRVPQGMHDAAGLEQKSPFFDLRLLLANQAMRMTSQESATGQGGCA